MAHRRSGRGLVRGPRRKTTWAEGPGGTAELVFNATQTQILGSGFEVTEEVTLARIRGAFSFNMESGGTGERMTGAFGIGIVTASAFAIGITAMPAPIDDQDWDGWLFWRPVQIQAVATLAEDQAFGSTRSEFEVDTRAMRKMQNDDTIYGALQVVENGTVVANAFFDSRALFLLH